MSWRFALWSLLRLAPVILLAALLAGGGWWVALVFQHQLAERMLAGVSSGEEISEAEGREWINLASARDAARFHAVEIALSKDSMVPKTRARAEVFVHAVVGLDPSGAISREVVQKFILPSLAELRDHDGYWSAVAVVPYLRLDLPESPKVAAALVERMKKETDSDSLSILGKALGGLSAKLEAKDVQPLAAALVERMKEETDSYRLSNSWRRAITGCETWAKPWAG